MSNVLFKNESILTSSRFRKIMTAILIIDLQKEFFDPKGILGEKYIRSIPLIQNITGLINHGRFNN